MSCAPELHGKAASPRSPKTERLAIPPEEKRYLDKLRLTREDMDEAWARGWNCARHVIVQEILDMPPLYPAFDPADPRNAARRGDRAIHAAGGDIQDGGPTYEQLEDELANVNR